GSFGRLGSRAWARRPASASSARRRTGSRTRAGRGGRRWLLALEVLPDLGHDRLGPLEAVGGDPFLQPVVPVLEALRLRRAEVGGFLDMGEVEAQDRRGDP